MTNDQQILTKAADLLDATGWTQGGFAFDAESRSLDYVEGKGWIRSSGTPAHPVCFCIVGAVAHVAALDTAWLGDGYEKDEAWPGRDPEVDRLLGHIVGAIQGSPPRGSAHRDYVTEVALVNDDKATTKEQAVAFLRDAAEAAA